MHEIGHQKSSNYLHLVSNILEKHNCDRQKPYPGAGLLVIAQAGFHVEVQQFKKTQQVYADLRTEPVTRVWTCNWSAFRHHHPNNNDVIVVVHARVRGHAR
jgi:hypothetical protein